jgi:hypothetical protein
MVSDQNRMQAAARCLKGHYFVCKENSVSHAKQHELFCFEAIVSLAPLALTGKTV